MKPIKPFLASLSILFFLLSGCSDPPSIHLPEKRPSELASTGEETRWSRVCFGSYPSQEIVPSRWNGVEDYALQEGDVMKDDALYHTLSSAAWNNDALTLDGVSYIREMGSLREEAQHYRDQGGYHYFSLQPLKWRVIAKEGRRYTLLSDKTIDCKPFHDLDEETDWSKSSLRAWLNDEKGGFYAKAFDDDEKKLIVAAKNANTDNDAYETYCGPQTEDKVYILSNDEVFASELGDQYGFYAGHGYDDPAKRFASTIYAKFHGTWYSPVAPYRGNSFWFMRTSGYTRRTVTYICDFGYIYDRGTATHCDDAGILPVIQVEADASSFSAIDEVSSLSIVKPGGGEGKENTCDVDVKPEQRLTMTFGEYPQDEVLPSIPNDNEDGIILDPELYERLENADWSHEVTIDGVEYRNLNDRYFALQPIEWNVLEQREGSALLFPTKGLDCVPYHSALESVHWEDSSLRKWLNEDFLRSAFGQEAGSILDTAVDNKDNFYFGTPCGNPTEDKVFLLGEEEIFCSEKASDYGFACSDATHDPNRCAKPTRYALARGAWRSRKNGNGFWMLRTNGYNTANAVYVGDVGDIYNRGMPVTCSDALIMPALRLSIPA